MIQKFGNLFVLETDNTSYLFQVGETGHLFQLYYGPKIHITEQTAEQTERALEEKYKYAVGNTVAYSKEHLNLALENRLLEMSSFGKGDVRSPFIEVRHSDGSMTADYLYQDYEMIDDVVAIEGMPYAVGEGVQTLKIVTRDKNYLSRLVLYYTVFARANVICRSAELINDSADTIEIEKLMSMQLDLQGVYNVTHFGGNWTNEMNRFEQTLEHGIFMNSSMTGTSSSRNNPFFMVSEKNCEEDAGICYGFNLVYSGNFEERVDVNAFGKTRVLAGIQSQCFRWQLGSQEHFMTPQSVMTVSKNGFSGLSENMHYFVREHIVRGVWQHKERPVLLNSWEAAYFKIDEGKLINMAKAAKEVGVELFVMDDGWFGHRDNDNSSLGDWYVDKNKLPGGLEGLSKKIHGLGLDFGIWVEPEMISEDSDLYRAHPDWAMRIPDKEHAEGRNQMILDLTRKEVCDYIVDAMKKVLSSASIQYVKWDMNRIFSDAFSTELAAEKQGEVFHRYVLGFYYICEKITGAFPEILFEGCSAGGNRFDLGMLCFFPQIWGSDNTDAVCRANIQTGYSYGYPLSTVTSHVSAVPNHQTLRNTPMETRFAVATAGVLGYELNLAKMNKQELEEIKEQITFYKKYRKTLQFGDYKRIKNGESTPYQKDIYSWNIVSKDKETAIGVYMQGQVLANSPCDTFKAKGLDPDMIYHIQNHFIQHNIKDFGDLVNTISPVYIKKDSLAHNVLAKFIKMDGEKDDFIVSGSVLNEAGMTLKMSFTGTGFDPDVRFFPDYGARIYIMEKVEE